MDSDQAYIIEYSGTVEPIRIQLWELTSLFLKKYTYSPRSSSKEGHFGMPNNYLKLLLYAILKVFNTVLEQPYYMKQYKLEQ